MADGRAVGGAALQTTRSNEKRLVHQQQRRAEKRKAREDAFSGSKEDMNSFGFYLGGYSCYPKKTVILRAVTAIGSLLPVDLITADRDIDLCMLKERSSLHVHLLRSSSQLRF